MKKVTVDIVHTKFTQILAFGNSYSDNGEARKISTAILQDAHSSKEPYLKPTEGLYWNHRYSNGHTAVEILAKKLDTKLINFATGGATSGRDNYTAWMDCLGYTGLLGQIDKYENSLDVKEADPDALYFIFCAENDYFSFMDFNASGSIQEVAHRVILNIETAVKRLITLGAKKFFIVNCSDLTMVPYEITMNRTEFAQIFVEYVNQNLPTLLKQIQQEFQISMTLFDHVAVSNKIIHHPKKYGLVELYKEYQSTYPIVKINIGNADSYYFWDEWHFSRVVHQIFGEQMYLKVMEYEKSND